MFRIILQLILLKFFLSIDPPGKSNQNYKIGNYYGSRYLDISLFRTYLDDSPSIVYWSNGQFLRVDDVNFVWISDPIDHTIKLISKDVIKIAVGQSMTAGYRDGDALNALLNKPSGLVHYKSNIFPQTNTIKYKPALFKKRTTDCLFSNSTNYTSCINEEASNNNLNIDYQLIKLIYFPYSEGIISNNTSNITLNNSSLNISNTLTKEYVFFTDKGNNCIRKIDINTAEVSVYAGSCDPNSFGFKDGPLGINRFNKPDGIGIDEDGNLFVYDSGNKYLRLISTDGYVRTLINGACFEYTMKYSFENPFKLKDSLLLCLKNWIKNYGKPDEHIVSNLNSGICYNNYYECVKDDPLVRERK